MATNRGVRGINADLAVTSSGSTAAAVDGLPAPRERITGPAKAPSHRRMSTPRTILAVAVLGSFMAFVDATIVNIAIPDIAKHFSGAKLSSVSWVLNAYNIVFAAFLVGGGQLADLLGRRRVFSVALVLFTISSVVCAVAGTLTVLVLARGFQAAGAAMLVPSSLAIVLEAHDEATRMRAVALWSAVAAMAAGIGPPLGGLLITASSWRLVFLVNLPVGIVALILTQRVIVESRAPGRRRMPDLLGGVVLAVAIGALVLAVVKGEEWGWANPRVLGSFAIALVMGAYFGVRSSRHRAPVIDLSLLRIRSFALSNGVTIVMSSGFYAYTLCNVLFLTEVWRYSILKAGLALTPGPFTAMAVAVPASRLVEKVGHRRVVVPGALIWTAGMVFFATTLGARPDFLGNWLPGMLILGLGAGLTFPTLSGAAVGSVPGPRFGVATSLNSVSRQIGAALGVAILIAIVGNPGPLEALHAFHDGWLFAGGCFLVGALICTALVVKRPGAGPAVAERRPRDLQATGEPLIEGLLPERSELPSLAESEGEQSLAEHQSIAEFLCNVEVFASLSEQMRGEIAELASDVTLKRDEWLFREGDEADSVFVVRVGQVEVVREKPHPQVVNTLTRGAVLGELALLSDSTRNAGVRAHRDTVLIEIKRGHFESLMRTEPELGLSLARSLGAQLKASRAIPLLRRGAPVTIAIQAIGAGVPLLELADEVSAMFCTWGRVAVLHPTEAEAEAGSGGAGEMSSSDAVAQFTPLVERCESSHDQVIMVCGASERTRAWDDFCLARADRVLVAVNPGSSDAAGHARECSSLRGCDLIAYGVERGSGSMTEWMTALAPVSTYAIRTDAHLRSDMARMARRLTGRAVGVVLSGGGARGFAHIGVIETLQEAGLIIDRVGGVSMGAFVGGLLACGHDPDAIDAQCYEEWVRRNPMNDYTMPRTSLIKGEKARTMLERVFGDVQIEELDRSFYCASVDLETSSLAIDRGGPLFLAIGSSMALPLIAPPQLRAERLLIDGSLLDNLPLGPMTSTGEGPVLAVDLKAGESDRPGEEGEPAGPAAAAREGRGVRIPTLPGTMRRIALLSSSNTTEARVNADFMVEVRMPGVSLFEFHQIDEARKEGRRAATEALEAHRPEWLTPQRPPASGLSGRRTVIRV
jgi:NTE family protein